LIPESNTRLACLCSYYICRVSQGSVLADAQSNLVTREHFDPKFALVQWMLGALLVLATTTLTTLTNFAKQYF